jgi:hypothetical protein|tara:strand:- start:377 stop:604 length:228 start_codon:yes stop_codon:yes gene_type:complete
MLVTSFGDEFLGASVEYSEKAKFEHMHKVTYIREGEEVFTNFVFNPDRKAGEKDSIDMAKEFVKQGKKTHGKQRI